MRTVVDTNVIVYHVLGASRLTTEIERFLLACDDLIAPVIWEAELANALWMSTRAGLLEPGDALDRLSLAGALGIQSQPLRSLWSGALLRSIESGVAVYDTLFAELAECERVPLVTYDRGLLKAFPELARRPGDLAV